MVEPSTIGQVFDYLMGLSFLFSKIEAFSILSNFTHTQILYTVDSIDLAAGKQLPQSFADEKIPLRIMNTATKSNLKLERVLYGSEIVNSCEPNKLFMLLCSALLKMKQCHNDVRKEESRMKMPICLSKNGGKAKKIEVEVKKGMTDLDLLDHSLLDELYLIKNLGGGGDGFCWFAITKKGDPLVLKSFHSSGKLEIEKESSLWNEIWSIKTVVREYAGKSYLLMPYIKPISSKDLEDKERFKKLSKEACSTFSNNGYLHNDLKIRHICKLKEESKPKYIFIDLSRVSKIENKEKAATEMLKTIEIDLDKTSAHIQDQTDKPSLIETRFKNLYISPDTPTKNNK